MIRHPNDTISRRRFIRGLGIAMSLPWLESLNSFGAASAGVSGESGAPRRLAVCFMGNGESKISKNERASQGSNLALDHKSSDFVSILPLTLTD